MSVDKDGRRAAPDAPFNIATSVELALVSTSGRLTFAVLYALASGFLQAWWISAAWLVLVVAWELLIRPALDRRVLALSSKAAMNAYAAVNLVGSALFAAMGLMGLANGSPAGIALAATWLTGSFISIFTYFAADRRILLGCLAPPLAVMLAGPFLAHGVSSQAIMIALLILASLVSARGYALDHRTLTRTLADRQMAFIDVERKLAVAIEASGDGLFDLDLQRDEVRFSATWAAMLGYGPGELPDPDPGWRRHVHPEDLPLVEQAYAAHFRGEIPHTTIEHRMICRDGQAKWVLARGRLTEWTPDGAPARVVGTMMDLTARKTLEGDLEAARDAAEAANKSKGAFLANMSHEIRTPLNGVIGTAGALSRRPLPADQREMVDLIVASAQTLDRLLSDVLDQAKIDAGQFQLAMAPFDLQREIEVAAELMRARADEKGVTFTVQYGPSARGLFQGDAVRLRQIITNLASNAVKFTANGEVRIDVAVEQSPVADAPEALVIKVADTGIGFDAEVASRLFTRFTQADSSISKRFGGTGLGLAICKALTELMQGRIDVASELGVGTLFTVEIPLRRVLPLADYDRGRTGAVQNNEPLSIEELEGLRILLAEDHPINQRVALMILEPMGARVTVACDGRQALDAYAPDRFDLVLMDMQMPVMDGLAAVREIRRVERDQDRGRIPIAMLTANAMEQHTVMAREAGADHLIAKPVTPDGLLAGILLTLNGADTAKDTRVAPTAGYT
ncbi:hybrid sensor histidine kinase/response regulator [Phenylobacterium montanum]|uniref:histidine kinase n=1 Tax=Phenylobacterium montanum TaxID=2823693 RepID=A0A975G5H4_9CAUL|nr:hybrid sensor histidine kinase/response regulator [Caulobacter sp. S6]QUD90416.1 response regulator [Caulobacter sp. S6]